MDFDTLKIFYRAAQAGSFLHSGVHLSPSAIGRKIALLEEELGAILFLRKRSGVELTDAGQRFLTHVTKLLAEFEAAKSDLHTNDPSVSTITVVTPTVWASGFIIPTLHDYHEKYPLAEIKLVGQDQMRAPNAMELVIQVFPHKDMNQTTESYRIAETKLKLFAHRDYLEKAGMPKSLDDLVNHSLLSHTNQLYPFVNFDWFIEQAAEREITLSPSLSTNNVIPFLRNGFGIATLVANHPLVVSGELVDVLPDLEGPSVEIYMTVHKTQKNYQQVINFRQLLTNKMANENALEGFR